VHNIVNNARVHCVVTNGRGVPDFRTGSLVLCVRVTNTPVLCVLVTQKEIRVVNSFVVTMLSCQKIHWWGTNNVTLLSGLIKLKNELMT